MEWIDSYGLSLATFLPVAGAVVLLLLPVGADGLLKLVGTVFSGLALVVGVLVVARFDYAGAGEIQLEVNATWIPQIEASYHIGIDGISLPLFALSLLVSFLCMIYCWFHIPEPGKTKAFLSLILLLETGMTGTFVALDLILFFIFFEVVLVPMYFLIGIWGGSRRQYAAVKFFLYTLFGSIFMLLGFLAIFFQGSSFDMIALRNNPPLASGTLQNIIFVGLFLGFAVKVPMWPFHTWLPDAHTEAPTVGSVLLAAIMLKMGTYGFIRIAYPILPDAAMYFGPVIGILAVIAIIYGALCCFAQTDLKRLIAFSSVGHMGFVMLGIATLTDRGINGAIFGMVAHGLITGMLFFLAGSMHERYHTREIAALGGMLQQIPRFGALLVYSAIASLGLPGLAGFWGEMLALLGSYQPGGGLDPFLFRILMIGGGIGTVLTAGYLLWTLQRVAMGSIPEKFAAGHNIPDVRPLEWMAWSPLLVLILAAGVYPKLVLGVTDEAVQTLLGAFGG
ncbi:MAG: NADH-quinone oxidoreductase subunit M [Actinobacteria bacterium]|nr:NADH-quinone oxidoreductase subunit M [Actinomycetota bacterium]